MVKTYIDDMVKINSDTGKDLLRITDNYRAKEVYCPLVDEQTWTEVDENAE